MTQQTTSLTDVLNRVILEEYTRLEDQHEVAIEPVLLADYAQAILDPEHHSPPEVEWSSILHLRELARRVCARRVSQDFQREDEAQEDLFDDVLQHRYPCLRAGRDCYVLRSQLTRSEYEENIRRLKVEADAKSLHALKLSNEMQSKILAGTIW